MIFSLYYHEKVFIDLCIATISKYSLQCWYGLELSEYRLLVFEMSFGLNKKKKKKGNEMRHWSQSNVKPARSSIWNDEQIQRETSRQQSYRNTACVLPNFIK